MTKRMLLMAGAVLIAAAPVSADAQSLQEALAAAYMNNPTLLAQRQRLRAADENVPQALSNWRPTVRLAGDIGRERTDARGTTTTGTQWRTPRGYDVALAQPIYRGGRTVAGVRQAENTVLAERALLQSTEQTVLLAAATAYVNVLRDQAVLQLNINNQQVLRRQLEAAQDRFRVGEITRTDVSQAEARLSRASADRVLAEGNLAASRATFISIVGLPPEQLTTPEAAAALPANLEEALALANQSNPNVLSAFYTAEAASDGINVVRGELLPQVSANVGYSRTYGATTARSDVEGTDATLNLTVPIYEAGAVYSRLRQQKHVAGQRRIEVDEARRDAIEQATQSWETLQTSRASVEAFEAQIRAAELALEGVQREAQVGARTVLDVLDAEQELLDARVSLVTAQRDLVVNSYQLKSAVGRMTAEALGLPVEVYDPTENYMRVRDKWIGAQAEVIPPPD